MTHDTTSRRRYLAGAASAGAVLTLGVSPASAQATTYELAMTTQGWRGVAPSDIEGEINPTLPVEVGQEYTIQWTNRTEEMHNLVVMDEDRSAIVRGEYVSEEGGSESVTFTAEEDQTTYLCENHFNEQGEFDVQGGTTTTTTMSDGNGEETTTTTTTEGTSPGFGVLAGLAGLGGVAAKLLYDRD